MGISGNLAGVLPGVGKRKKVFLPASTFGGVNANAWRPSNATGSAIHLYLYLEDIYPRSSLEIRVLWSTSNTTTTNTHTWRVRLLQITFDTDAAAGGTFAAISTALVADTVLGTANAIARTAAGVIAPGVLKPNELYILKVDVSATDLTLGDTDNVQFYGLELAYAQGLLQ